MTDQKREQDYISKKCVPLKYIDEEKWYRFVTNTTYKPILDVFFNIKKNGPIPIDIDVLSRQYDKSTSTVYRYIKDLLDAGLLIEAGRRVFPKKPSSKILYDLSASLFIPIHPLPAFWSSDHGTNVIKTVGFMLRRYFGGLPIIPQLSEAYAKFEQDSYNLVHELMLDLVRREQMDNNAAIILNEIRNLPKAPYFFATLAKILWFIQQHDYDEVVAKFGSFYGNKVQIQDLFTVNELNTSIGTRNLVTGDQDVITYIPDLIQLVDEETWNRYIKNFNHRATRILLTTPKTLAEIHEEHQQAVSDLIDNDKHYKHLTKEKIEKIKGKIKEKKTIYQYLTDLKKDGLIVEAGRRITAGRSVTEILYAKKGFYMRKGDTDKKLQENEDWKKLVNVIGLAVQHHLQKKGFDREKLLEILSDYELSKEEHFNEIYGRIKIDSAVEIISAFDDKLSEIFIDTLVQLEWFLGLGKKDNIHKKLLDCFTG
ncbi:MAG: hypothetical protein ACFFAE_20195 [Candidatus Hodarchaeota archaeon]